MLVRRAYLEFKNSGFTVIHTLFVRFCKSVAFRCFYNHMGKFQICLVKGFCQKMRKASLNSNAVGNWFHICHTQSAINEWVNAGHRESGAAVPRPFPNWWPKAHHSFSTRLQIQHVSKNGSIRVELLHIPGCPIPTITTMHKHTFS